MPKRYRSEACDYESSASSDPERKIQMNNCFSCVYAMLLPKTALVRVINKALVPAFILLAACLGFASETCYSLNRQLARAKAVFSFPFGTTGQSGICPVSTIPFNSRTSMAMGRMNSWVTVHSALRCGTGNRLEKPEYKCRLQNRSHPVLELGKYLGLNSSTDSRSCLPESGRHRC